ncbi:hypothetical protein L6164_016724 [Bauhinia variegata]|uniref:Uncharacterized protein n=1 Tax=Bauhinia variegata TaxID=167791 RepID=A0ACB9N595_BAUVA|nr:hypothetical protein L6164_016724 [Bauhinia variegata]
MCLVVFPNEGIPFDVKSLVRLKFSRCCHQGKVQLPLLPKPPNLLTHFLFDHESFKSKMFQNTHVLNMVFSFTSFSAKMDKSLSSNKGLSISESRDKCAT